MHHPSQQRRDLLFHSQRCEHCRALIESIVRQQRRDAFLFVCVDRPGLKIPAFVDRVPTIYTSDGRVLVDAAIDMYLRSPTANATQPQQTQEDADVLPFTLGATLNVDQYAYLTNDGNAYVTDDALILDHANKDMVHSQAWVSLATAETGIDVSSSTAANDSRSGGNNASKFDDKSYERYMDARKKDEDDIKRTLTQQAAGDNALPPAFVR